MKSGVLIIVSGGVMAICGLMMFYGIQSIPQIEPGQKDFFRAIKHAGTFIGLLGIGVTLAGFLLYIINRNQTPIHEDMHTDVKE